MSLTPAIDSAHCTALKHEFLRCEDAFKDFESSATNMILTAQAEAAGQPPQQERNRWIAYKTYNAYSRFILHLYEFVIGACTRDTRYTRKIKAEDAEKYIASHAQRILTRTREAILNGSAPAWENHISAYPERIPEDFAREFRRIRNKVIGHVTHERSSLSLSDFYNTYHQYLYMLYRDCLGHWGLRNQEFPDLKEITEFSVLIKANPQH